MTRDIFCHRDISTSLVIETCLKVMMGFGRSLSVHLARETWICNERDLYERALYMTRNKCGQ